MSAFHHRSETAITDDTEPRPPPIPGDEEPEGAAPEASGTDANGREASTAGPPLEDRFSVPDRGEAAVEPGSSAEVPDFGREVAAVENHVAALDKKVSDIEARRSWPRFVAVLAAIVAAVVISFLIGRVTAPDEAGEPQVVAPVATTVATTAAPTTAPPTTTTTAAPTTTTTTRPPETTTTPPPTTIPVEVLQPVAQIAADVGPAVVQIEAGEALGAGVIYDQSGLILTAAHVLETAGAIVDVRLGDGRVVEGEIVGAHAPTDVAVIKIEAFDGIQVAELAPADSLRIGDTAVALGSPFGLEQTVTAGIVSAIDRIVDNVIMVQTDAAINPGNSGGPLVDTSGRVIGINDQIFTLGGGNEGVGFAISIELVSLVAEQLVAGQEVRLAFLGVQVSPIDSDPPGALIEEVVPGSAADGAGLKEGDLIVKADDRLIISSAALRARVIKRRPGDTLVLEILREGEMLTLSVVLGETGV